MFKHFNRSSPWVWLSAGFLSLNLIAVLGFMLLIGWKGLTSFWPVPVYQFKIQTPEGVKNYFGEIFDVENVPSIQLKEAGVSLLEPQKKYQRRYLINIGHRERETKDFISVLEQNILSKVKNPHIAVIERTIEGVIFGIPVGAIDQGQTLDISGDRRLASHDTAFFQKKIALSQLEQEKTAYLQKHINEDIIQKRIKLSKKLKENKTLSQTERTSLSLKIDKLDERYKTLENKRLKQIERIAQNRLVIDDRKGVQVFIPFEDVVELWYPNLQSLNEKWGHFLSQIGRFVSENPRAGNSEGGVFPAIFGTVLMVMLMAAIVTPLGVLAALYLHEYAKRNLFTRIIRIAVINLAGVPSIVYGVFGLGFFVYFIGGNIDALFYSKTLPSPTFGTPGLLWSSLTLALLTLPVVIVSTEEGLSRIPVSVRHASMALGATQAETLWRIVLPMASPAIMTGLVLAIARAAGEVAPLMLVGVVKIAPNLPLDSQFPYLHLDRKFMHLGYHIYDAGFQSPNIEAARPLVYATSFLLLTVIIGLNLTAMSIRHHLREKYRALDQDI